MHPSHDMHFGDGLSVITLHDIQHLLLAELPALVPVRVYPRIGTELAGEYTHIRGLDMEIAVEIGLVAMFSLPDVIGQAAEIGEIVI